MGADLQSTLARAITFKGVGLHNGRPCSATLRPAPVGTGVVFIDQGSSESAIAATPDNVVATNHGTVIASGAAKISTIEHLMAALALARVDNAVVETTGNEVPIMDGSSADFFDAIISNGTTSQHAARRMITIDRELCVRDGDREISITPADQFSMDIMIDFEGCAIGYQRLVLDLEDSFTHQRLASARTFCRLHEVEMLRGVGLIKGGSLDNSIVVDGDQVLNDKLRDPQEFVLHKALDLLGDLYLAGGPIRGAVKAVKPGHDLNTEMASLLSRTYRDNLASEDAEPRFAVAG